MKSIVDGINEIAKQTNILDLNANIEATSQEVSAFIEYISDETNLLNNDANTIKAISQEVYNQAIEVGNMGEYISKIEDLISNLAKLSNESFYENNFKMDNAI